MRWQKKGVIYCSNGSQPWALTHAGLPTPYKLNDEILRIYCSFRAEKNVGRIGYVDVLADNPKTVVGVSDAPALDIGQPGTFDDNGVAPVSLVPHDGKLYLYYGGFELGTKIPYTLFSGLAISLDGGNRFVRHAQVPLLDRTERELFFRTVPFVLKEGSRWKMWYIGGSAWVEQRGKMLPMYTVKYLESEDGIHWGNEPVECFALQGDEHGFGRPFVMKVAGGYEMYYSIRSLSKGYRLGYAQSPDGKVWIRRDEHMGLDVSEGDIDSDMVCYSAVVNHRNKTYLFYNGNNYGGTGICFAEREA